MFAKNYHFHWIARRANILYKYLIYIFFNFGRGFSDPFLYYFQKLKLLAIKKFWNNFCCIALLFVWDRKACLRFLKSYFKLEIYIDNIFVHRRVFFSTYAQLKRSFSDEKKQHRWNVRHTLVEKLLEINVAKY